MVSVFEKTSKMKNRNNKTMAFNQDHQDFLKRIKKSLYYGPSNPNRMTSFPLASHVAKIFTDSHKHYSIKTLDLDAISRVRQQTPCSLILTIIYLERLNKLDPAFVRTVSPQELFLVALMVSTKFYSDYDEIDVFARTWAEESEIDIGRLVDLEILFLNAIQWNILVSQNEFFEKLKTVEKLIAMKEGLSRGGWFTYTELEMLMPSLELAKLIFNFSTILMLSYACSIATLALSGIIMTSLATIPPLSPTSRPMLPEKLIPKIDGMSREGFYDEMYNQEAFCNFTLNFPLLNEITNWEMRQNQGSKELTDFKLMPRKYEMPLNW